MHLKYHILTKKFSETQFIVKAGDYAAEKIKTPASKGVQAARDSLHAAIAKAREATDPDVAVKMAWDAWNVFASYPAGKNYDSFPRGTVFSIFLLDL